MTRDRLKALLTEYGRVAIWTYFGLFFLVLGGFLLAIAWGAKVESAGGGAGALGAAYLATKLTQPIRIAATLALTPIVARVVAKLRARSGNPSPPPEQPSSDGGATP